MADILVGLLAGFLVATVTTPVGISGAVFLLPVQLQLLHIPSPQITPTNLLFNVISTPGALLRYRGTTRVDTALTLRLLTGTVPGVILGATLRVFAAPGDDIARVLAILLLAPIGCSLLRPGPARAPRALARRVAHHQRSAAFVVGCVGGVYGIGGGSVLSPLLVAGGLSIGLVAPAALACTWVTSIVGALAFAALSMVTPGAVAPDWTVGLACGVGGLMGGYLGARLQPRLPETLLRRGLGIAALAISTLFLFQVLA